MKTLRRSPRLRSSFEQRQPQLRVPAPFTEGGPYSYPKVGAT
jgi:hypothetical protein